jgi:hypothetical protein
MVVLSNAREKAMKLGNRQAVSPQLELLERREVPAALVFTRSTGVLTVNVAEIDVNRFGMSCAGDGNLMVQGFLSETRRNPVVGATGKNGTLDVRLIKKVVINGSEFDDKINLSRVGLDTTFFKNPTIIIDGKGGNDLINGSQLNDVIHGGNGNDTLIGEGGHDTIFGDLGNDNLFGDYSGSTRGPAGGNDWLEGGIGDDFMAGGGGNDTMVGQVGRDQFDGGQGYDAVFYDSADFSWILVEMAKAGSPTKK